MDNSKHGNKKNSINEHTYDLLFKDYYNLPKEENNGYENLLAWVAIDDYTKAQPENLYSDKITFNDKIKQYEYKNNGLTITFDKISNYITNQNLIEELTTKKRYRECHLRTMTISLGIENSRIVTGYITVGNGKFLHSVIEYDQDDQTIILDWVRNLKITKEQYIKLTKFVEITAFESTNVIDDMQKMLEIGIKLKPYLVFRNELVKDIEKNAQIFNFSDDEPKRVIQAFRDELINNIKLNNSNDESIVVTQNNMRKLK